jgi:hypothetical protein
MRRYSRQTRARHATPRLDESSRRGGVKQTVFTLWERSSNVGIDCGERATGQNLGAQERDPQTASLLARRLCLTKLMGVRTCAGDVLA